MRSLNVSIEETIRRIPKIASQLSTIEQSVGSIINLEDSLKGQTGEAIRTYYQTVHEPLLQFMQQSLTNYMNILIKVHRDFKLFEPDLNGLVHQGYIEEDVRSGLTRMENMTADLVAQTNQDIASIADLAALPRLEMYEFSSTIRVAKNKTRGIVEQLHNLDYRQTNTLDSVKEDVELMKQAMHEMNKPFQEGNPDRSPFHSAPAIPLPTANIISERVCPASDIPEGNKVTYTPEKEANVFVRSVKGTGLGLWDSGKDLVVGTWNMVRHPIESTSSIIEAVAHPIDTGKYIGQAISDSYERDMINGDAESRAHWVSYSLGTIASSVISTKGAGAVTKAGAETTKAGAKLVSNSVKNVELPNLLPYYPRNQLATVRPTKLVPYSVVDGKFLKEQMIVKAQHFVDGTKGKLRSNITYRAGEFNYLYKTDDMGRIKEFTTEKLQLTNRDKRLAHNPDSPGKLQGDHAGHLAGDRFGGSPELDNIVSQLEVVNLGKYKKIENQWAKAISAGKTVSVNVKVNYSGNSLRPKSFDVEFTIDGWPYISSIKN